MSTTLHIADDDFRLFGLDERFAQDRCRVDARWKALLAEVHPDRFAAEGDAAQRIAVQWAVRVNEAYRRLRDPLTRAAYLCELHGEAVAEGRAALPSTFLMQQMAWREALAEAHGARPLEALAAEVGAQRASMLVELERLIDERRDWPAAAAQVRALMFVARLAADLDERLDALAA